MTELKTLGHLEKNTCILCGEETHRLSEMHDRRCDFCGQIKSIPVECENFHCICSDCLAMTPNQYVKSMCMKYKGINPIELAVEIMNSPLIRMHGAEHHFIVPAVLTTCVHNLNVLEGSLADKLEKIERRAERETPRVCSYELNTCGAAIGTGVFISTYLNHELQDEDEWSLSNQIVAESIKRVAESGGPRCCKRDTYLSIEAAVAFLNDKFAIDLPLSDAKCTFSLRNRTCRHEECQFYNLSNSLV